MLIEVNNLFLSNISRYSSADVGGCFNRWQQASALANTAEELALMRSLINRSGCCSSISYLSKIEAGNFFRLKVMIQFAVLIFIYHMTVHILTIQNKRSNRKRVTI